MAFLRRAVVLCLTLAGPLVQAQSPQSRPPLDEHGAPVQMQPAKQEQLFALANQARAAAGVGRLEWDPALAAAALNHCLRMAAEGPIAHRYGGEPDLTERAAQAGAHFSLIEENIAIGSYPATIHQGWMQSPDHRANLLNPEVDRVGIAVVAGGGVLYAVADFSRAVPSLSRDQVEAVFAALLRARGLTILKDSLAARAYCVSNSKFHGDDPPGFLMRWQNSDLTQLPQPLIEHLGSYRKAAVGSCPAQDVNGAFTTYRVAVLLY